MAGNVGRVAIALIGICIAGILAYLIYVALRAHLGPILFFANLTVGVVFALAGAIFLFMSLRSFGIGSLAQGAARASMTRVNRLRNDLGNVCGFLSVVAGGLSSLEGVVKGARTRAGTGRPGDDLTRISAQSQFEGTIHKSSRGVLVFSLVLFGLCYFRASGEGFWFAALAASLAASVVLRHFAYAVSPVSLPRQLCRQLGSPYASIFVIGVSDLVSLVLLIDIVSHRGDPTIIDAATFGTIAQTLIFGGIVDLIKAIFNHEPLSTSNVIITLIGAVYSLNIIDTARSYREFERTDEDNLIIAANYCFLSNYNAALKALEQVKVRLEAFYRLRATAHLGLMQVDRAWADMETSFSRSNAEALSSPQKADVLFSLASVAIFSNIEVEPRRKLVMLAIEREVPDIYIAYKVYDLFSDPRHAGKQTLLPTLADAQGYPFTDVTLMMLVADFEGAAAKTRLLNPVSMAEVTYAMRVDFMSSLMGPTSTDEDRMFVARWTEQHLQYFSNLDLLKVSKVDMACVFSNVMLVATLVKMLRSPLAQAWEFVLDRFQSLLPDQERPHVAALRQSLASLRPPA